MSEELLIPSNGDERFEISHALDGGIAVGIVKEPSGKNMFGVFPHEKVPDLIEFLINYMGASYTRPLEDELVTALEEAGEFIELWANERSAPTESAAPKSDGDGKGSWALLQKMSALIAKAKAT